ncbi:hypothetical protein M3Y99_01980700 [Aphelenchoides fujianensis]|nr:hypothetical protein M3Y99_01980700 [Aphelenchoides fujianensis]
MRSQLLQAKVASAMLLYALLACMILAAASEKQYDDRNRFADARDARAARFLARHSRSAARPSFELDVPLHQDSPMSVQSKRERPLVGYGWESCEFSPMSCLLRRRRAL